MDKPGEEGRGDGREVENQEAEKREKGQETERAFPGPCPELSPRLRSPFLKEFISQKSLLQGPHIPRAA